VLAVACVVADHALGLWGDALPRVPLFAIGHAGVAIFFVHTAAVLMASLERMVTERPAALAPLTARFMVRRALRIYPLAIVAIGAVVLAQVPATAGRLSAPPTFVAPSAGTLAANLALVQNLGTDVPLLISVLWTLPIEVQLYLLLPVAHAAARRSVRGALAVLLVALLVGTVVRLPWVPGVAPLNALRFAPAFAGGVLAWALTVHAPARRRWSAPVAMAAVLAIVSGYVVIAPWSNSAVKSWALGIPLGVVVSRLPELRAGAVATWAERIARHSYGIYLFHVPLLWLAFQHWRWLGVAGGAAVFAVTLAATCWASHRWIEAPAIAWGRRLSR
jgi:peptidoglycan/LPS O-acetylase OafA/YrhL